VSGDVKNLHEGNGLIKTSLLVVLSVGINPLLGVRLYREKISSFFVRHPKVRRQSRDRNVIVSLEIFLARWQLPIAKPLW